MSEHPSKAPFQAHKHYYLAIKLAVLAAAVFVAVRYLTGG